MGIPKKAIDARKKASKPAPSAPSELPEGYARDEKTGKTYRTIPKLDINADGRSEVVVDGLADCRGDPLDTAEEFLGHLRVAPTPEELAELRAESLRRARERKAKAAAEANRPTPGGDER